MDAVMIWLNGVLFGTGTRTLVTLVVVTILCFILVATGKIEIAFPLG